MAEITKRRYDGDGVLWSFIGDYAVHFPESVYSIMQRICKEFTGGPWDFCMLNNGGFFLELVGKEMLKLEDPNAGFCEMMTREAASIAVCLLALKELKSSGLMKEADLFHLLRLYERLLEYAAQHDEFLLIIRLVNGGLM